MIHPGKRYLIYARAGIRFFLGLRRSFRPPLDSNIAQSVVRERFARRDQDFLNLARRFIYESGTNPYRHLLRHAGCEYGDLEDLVRRDGLEGALTVLFRNGVFLTVDEFKGRQPVVRGTFRETFKPADLTNPTAVLYFVGHSSGSRGERTPVPFDLAFVREHAVNRRLSLEARGALGWRHAICGSAGGGEMAIVLRFALCGAAPERWFTPVDPRVPGLPLSYRWSGFAMRMGGLAAGVSLPAPVPVSPDALFPIVEWMRQILAEGETPHLKTYASMAVRVCRTAAEAGVDLSGAQFTLTGEPLSQARLDAVARSGAWAAPDYGSTEVGQVGEPCVAPGAPDDVHLLEDLHGIIQAGTEGKPYGLPSGALLITSLRTTAPYILLNVSMGDEARLTTRTCGCPLEGYGWRRHLHAIRSFEKLTSGGMTFFDTDVARVLEELLPSRFGGAPTHYQLVEEEGPGGVPRLSLRVDPAVGPVDSKRVADVFLRALGDASPGDRSMELMWRGIDVLRVVRASPLMTPSGKILHLHRE
jgi:hypothetical protein